MPKLSRITQLVFGSGAGPTDIGKFGSLAAGSVVYSQDPSVIQTLSQWLQGWASAVVGANSPTIQDRNAVDFVHSRQIAYLLEQGVAEYDPGTTYYIGCIVAEPATGVLFVSLTNNNTNNALTSTSHWRRIAGAPVVQSFSVDTVLNVNTTNARITSLSPNVTMPDATTNLNRAYVIKNAGSGTPHVIFTGGQSADGQTDIVLQQYQCITLRSNGTNYDIEAFL